MEDQDENIDLPPGLEDWGFIVGEFFFGLGHWFCFRLFPADRADFADIGRSILEKSAGSAGHLKLRLFSNRNHIRHQAESARHSCG